MVVGGFGGGGEEGLVQRTGSIFSSAYLNELLDIRNLFRHDGRVRVGGEEEKSRFLFSFLGIFDYD